MDGIWHSIIASGLVGLAYIERHARGMVVSRARPRYAGDATVLLFHVACRRGAPLMQATEEQQAAIESAAKVRVIQAFAGTGKTTTLRMLSERLKGDVLYLAFTKANQEDAVHKFPPHVKCLTTHALAFPTSGRPFRAKLIKSLPLKAIIDALGMQPDYAMAAEIRKALLTYFASASATIEETVSIERRADAVVHGAKRIWAMMQDPTNATIGMLHDGYLKLFQLRRPFLRYDHILFDEAQDANPVTSAIVAGQSCAKTYVGDQHQQIYQFRGAQNAMRSVDGERFCLTQSWRFGSRVAQIANRILAEKGEESMVVGMNGQGEIAPVDTSAAFATICRTNAGVFSFAAESAANGECLHFIGGVENYQFDRIADAWNLKSHNLASVRDSALRGFGTFDEMQRCAEESNDLDLKGLARAVETYGDAIPQLIENIKTCASDADHANQTLVTAHKSKGLEFEQVRLADDFLDLQDYRDLLRDPKQDQEQLECEINLVYVAATRALKRLQPNPKLQNLLPSPQETYSEL